MKKANWIWMPHAAHFILGSLCQFKLATYVGGYIVSTVGEYLPDAAVKEILAESRGIKIEGRGDARIADYQRKIGFEDIGCDRKYETMVFKANPSKHKCCPFRMESGTEIDMDGYNDSDEAMTGHIKMCKKWAVRT